MRLPVILVSLGCLFIQCVAPCVAFDSRFAGSWSASYKGGGGYGKINWQLDARGKYHSSFSGYPPKPDEVGQLYADNGHWSKVGSHGMDGGVYKFSGSDSFVLIGHGGAAKFYREQSSTNEKSEPEDRARPAQKTTAGQTTSGSLTSLASAPAELSVVNTPAPAVPAPDNAVVGTWTQPFSYHGKTLTAYMRLGRGGDYRGWFDGVGEGSSSGRFVTHNSDILVDKFDGPNMSARYEVSGDRLVMIKQNGAKQLWQRAGGAIAAPGENEPGLTGEEAKDPQKCLALGNKLYKLGDMKDACAWHLKAAEMGNRDAQLNVGWYYENGAGVNKNYGDAARWYAKAAANGEPTAMKNLGQMYENGTGVKEDWTEAAKLYAHSAQAGDASGTEALARAYRFGLGVQQNRALAIEWYKKAAALGCKDCSNQARWLSDGTNFVGFRNQAERNLVMNNGYLATSALYYGADPSGRLFHDSSERTAFMRGFAGSVAKDEAESAARRNDEFNHDSKVNEYEKQGYSHSEAESKALLDLGR